MSLRKRILLLGFVMSLIFYGASAFFFATSSSAGKREEIANFLTYITEQEQLNILRDRHTIEWLAKESIERRIPYLKLNYELGYFKIVSYVGYRDGQFVTNAYPSSIIPPIPHGLLSYDDPYMFFYTNSSGQLFFTYALKYQNPNAITKLPAWMTLAVPKNALRDRLHQLNYDVTVMEYSEGHKPLAIYSTVSEKELPHYMPQFTEHIAEDIATKSTLQQETLREMREKVRFVNINNEKYLLIPSTLINNKILKQIIYYTVPLKDFRVLDENSTVMFVLFGFVLSLSALFAGYYFSDPKLSL